MAPDNLLKRDIRPAFERASMVGRGDCWHNFRHLLATNRKRPEDARYLPPMGLAEARREREGGGDDVTIVPKKLRYASAPSTHLGAAV